MALSSGIYGLFRLDGGPIDPLDAKVLELSNPQTPGPALAEAVDAHAPTSLHRAEDQNALTILLGDIEEEEALADRLHMEPSTLPALLARAALRRFGGDTPAEMIGEWSLLHWDRAGSLTLMSSAARRDPLLYAVSADRVAVAPDLFRLGRIPWVGSTLDEAGLLFAIGRAELRAGTGDRTMLARVHQLEPGTGVTISSGAFRKLSTQIFAPQPRWSAGFEDAMAEVENLLRRIVRSRMARTAAPASLLSGGLDSSTLSWLAAEERGGDQSLQLITSVAPPASGLRDEAEWADTVAERLGLQSDYVWPSERDDIYRPPESLFARASRPPLEAHHRLSTAIEAAAQKRGATLIVDGRFGEMTITGRLRANSARQRLREFAATMRGRSGILGLTQPPLSPFHVRLSAHRLQRLPDDVRQTLRAPVKPPPRPGPGDLVGYHPGAPKAMLPCSAVHPGAIRRDAPFRDLRLLRLFAGFPREFLRRDGLDRAPARHLLAGRLPDAIRFRTSGLGASPDHNLELQRQAPRARARIAAFRVAQIDEWLDLDWLDGALARVAERGPLDIADAFEVQLTALAAEFLTWWRTRA